MIFEKTIVQHPETAVFFGEFKIRCGMCRVADGVFDNTKSASSTSRKTLIHSDNLQTKHQRSVIDDVTIKM
jgi:hypothetical protein